MYGRRASLKSNFSGQRNGYWVLVTRSEDAMNSALWKTGQCILDIFQKVIGDTELSKTLRM